MWPSQKRGMPICDLRVIAATNINITPFLAGSRVCRGSISMEERQNTSIRIRTCWQAELASTFPIVNSRSQRSPPPSAPLGRPARAPAPPSTSHPPPVSGPAFPAPPRSPRPRPAGVRQARAADSAGQRQRFLPPSAGRRAASRSSRALMASM